MAPRELYAERRAARQTVADELTRRERTLSIARLVSIGLAILITFWSVAGALLPVIVFIALVIVHERVVRERKRAENRAAFYARGLARIEGTWAGGGDAGEDLEEEHHPYSADFDLFGKGSIFELISLATTRAGRERLGAWLKTPVQDVAEIRSRQAAALELRENVDLREDLAVAAREVAKDVESAKLDDWAAMPPARIAGWERVAVIVLPALCILLLLLSLPSIFARLVGLSHPEAFESYGILGDFPLWPLGIAVLAAAFFARHIHARVEPIVVAVERAEPALALLAGLVARIERESFDGVRLAGLSAR